MRKLVYSMIAFAGAAVYALPVYASSSGTETHNHTEGWNTLWNHLLWDIGVIGVLFAAISVYFLVTYTRKRDDQVGDGPKFSFGQALGWALIPSFIFLADDLYLAAGGWKLWIDQRTVPENAMEVKVLAQQWSWEFEYENGATSDGDEGLVVPVGQPVVLRMTSDDVIHGFFIPDFRIKEDVMPGRVTYIWFDPVKKGEYVFTCTEYCGTNHSNMPGMVKVVSPAQFEKWSQEHQG